MSDGKGCECGARYYGECACDDVSWACGDCEEKDKRIAELEDKLAMAEQISGEYCDKCGWAMKFPDEPCRCELVKRIAELERAISTHRTARHSAGAPEDWDLWKLVDNTNE